ncbi:MAG: DUF1329 domain-containing protein [Gammaproteobacteria bacterium]|uniref:DUF1329 domain-containing protein n=1 Tax=Bradyrhizobium sp. TaxID=376 RepID=UPI003D0C7E90
MSIFKCRAVSVAILALVTFVQSGRAVAVESIPQSDLMDWIAAPAPAVLPDAGTILTNEDHATIAALMPPGYSQEFDFAGAQIEIQAPLQYTPPAVYQEATARFAGQARIAADGAIENHTAGLPFSDAQILSAPPEQAGYMVGWNRVYRWQHFGWHSKMLMMSYIHATPDGRPGRLVDGLEGGGDVDRYVTQNYHRVYLSHLAIFPDNGYRVDASDSGERLYKDYVEFFEPFDVQGTKFVIERSLDPHEEDQVNSYLPTQRRVRRLSAEERADSFMGSDMTFDDFEGFSGRVLDYEWRYLGRKDVLGVAAARTPLARFFGPSSRVPRDRWQVRSCHVIELRPKWRDHPYASKYLFVDRETFNIVAAAAVNHAGEVWKLFTVVYYMAEPSAAAPLETSAPIWAATIAIDRIRGTATVARAMEPTLLPTMTKREIERRFSVSSLTEGR